MGVNDIRPELLDKRIQSPILLDVIPSADDNRSDRDVERHETSNEWVILRFGRCEHRGNVCAATRLRRGKHSNHALQTPLLSWSEHMKRPDPRSSCRADCSRAASLHQLHKRRTQFGAVAARRRRPIATLHSRNTIPFGTGINSNGVSKLSR